jgi:excisionase family DNA binding protein
MAVTSSPRGLDGQAAAAGQYFTVGQAARRLQVSTSTVWRWIEAGKLPAYRVGPKAIRIKEEDLRSVIRPVKDKGVAAGTVPLGGTVTFGQRTLTDEEVAQRLAALHRASTLRAELLARRGGTPLPSSVDLIRQVREELSERL